MSFDLTETVIRKHSSSESFRRGEDYYRRGNVFSLTRRGNVLRVEVGGSQFASYEVRVAFDEGGITEPVCSCPYDWGGWCKHIVAALLACIHEPESVRERPALEEILSELDRDQLQTILLRLAEHAPSLAEVIESELSLAQTPSPAPHRPAVETASIRYQVRSIIHSVDYMEPSGAYWHTGGVVHEVSRVLDGAWSFIEAGDGRNALLVLEAITDEYMEAWELLDDSDGEIGGFFEDLGAAWTEVLLSVDLTPQEQERWSRQLDVWWGELDDYGVGEAFDPPLRASMRRHILSRGRRGGPSWSSATAVPLAPCFHPHFLEPTIFGGSVHFEIRLFGLHRRRRCNLPISLSFSLENGTKELEPQSP